MGMKRAYYRIGFTAGQSDELWERWKRGEGLKAKFGERLAHSSMCRDHPRENDDIHDSALRRIVDRVAE